MFSLSSDPYQDGRAMRGNLKQNEALSVFRSEGCVAYPNDFIDVSALVLSFLTLSHAHTHTHTTPKRLLR